MRRITGMALNLEPEWRHNGPELTSGYEPHRRPGQPTPDGARLNRDDPATPISDPEEPPR